jgi:hypothetical protein
LPGLQLRIRRIIAITIGTTLITPIRTRIRNLAGSPSWA